MAREPLILRDIAHGRSGDKGNHANIAIIAYRPAGFAWLREHLTAERVAGLFRTGQPSRVERYEAANLLALNFVLYDVLAGGASRSLRVDSQGKTLALALLDKPFERPDNYAAMCRLPARPQP
jgi:DNA-binding LacI/PurR family transcriptional regulator